MSPNVHNRHIIDILFVLSLFLLFSASSVVLILFGVNIYNKTTSSMSANYSSRTSAAYITEKIHQSDMNGSVYIDNKDGCKRLVMTSTVQDQAYAAYLYEYEGFLYELYSRADLDLPPDAGQPVIPLSGLDFEFITPSLLQVSYTDEFGKDSAVYICVHSAAGAEQSRAGGV